MTNIQAIKKFFESGKSGGRVTMAELKDVSPESRKELGDLAKIELEGSGS